jgi:hypothetical protein
MRRWLPILLLLATSCSDQPVVVLRISTDTLVPGGLSKLYIYLTASRTKTEEEWNVCEPIMVPYWLGSKDDLPLYHAVFQGDEYDERLAYKIVGFRTGLDEPVFQGRLGHSAWPLRGEHEIKINLESSCFNRSDCPPGEQREGGECVDAPIPDVFVDDSYWDEGVSCAIQP